jgi:hypothetical protein
MRDCEANGIDGLDIKSLWLLQKIPAAPSIVFEGTARQLQFLTRLLGIPGFLQRVKHSLPHLSGGCEREGDGQDLFRFVHLRKQLQQPARQQLCLA